MNKYKILSVIGDGTYGVVYKAINTETNEKVAIKKLKTKISSWQECISQSEVSILKKLNHENIIKLHEIIREQNSDVSYIFEYADINLYQYIDSFRKNNQRIPEHKIKNIIFQIINGVKYLHDNGIMHRDLKPENILMMQDTNLIKICDFGTARSFTNENSIEENTPTPFTDYVCTRWYRAPECVLKSLYYNQSIDVWAIGCVLCELYLLKPVFPGNDEFDQLNKICNLLGTPEYKDWPEGFKLIQKLGLKFPICGKRDLREVIGVNNICNEAVALLDGIFKWDCRNRLSAGELLNCRFFGEVRPNTYSFQNRFDRSRGRGDNYRNYSNFNNYEGRKGRGYDGGAKVDSGNGTFNEYNENYNGRLNGTLAGYGGYNNMKNSNSNNIGIVNINNPYKSDISKNDSEFLRNLNYDSYQKNNGIIPDINTYFNKDDYINNILRNQNNFSPQRAINYNNKPNYNNENKNKFQLMAENNMFTKRKFNKGTFFNNNNNNSNNFNFNNHYNSNSNENMMNGFFVGNSLNNNNINMNSMNLNTNRGYYGRQGYDNIYKGGNYIMKKKYTQISLIKNNKNSKNKSTPIEDKFQLFKTSQSMIKNLSISYRTNSDKIKEKFYSFSNNKSIQDIRDKLDNKNISNTPLDKNSNVFNIENNLIESINNHLKNSNSNSSSNINNIFSHSYFNSTDSKNFFNTNNYNINKSKNNTARTINDIPSKKSNNETSPFSNSLKYTKYSHNTNSLRNNKNNTKNTNSVSIKPSKKTIKKYSSHANLKNRTIKSLLKSSKNSIHKSIEKSIHKSNSQTNLKNKTIKSEQKPSKKLSLSNQRKSNSFNQNNALKSLQEISYQFSNEYSKIKFTKDNLNFLDRMNCYATKKSLREKKINEMLKKYNKIQSNNLLKSNNDSKSAVFNRLIEDTKRRDSEKKEKIKNEQKIIKDLALKKEKSEKNFNKKRWDKINKRFVDEENNKNKILEGLRKEKLQLEEDEIKKLVESRKKIKMNDKEIEALTGRLYYKEKNIKFLTEIFKKNNGDDKIFRGNSAGNMDKCKEKYLKNTIRNKENTIKNKQNTIKNKENNMNFDSFRHRNINSNANIDDLLKKKYDRLKDKIIKEYNIYITKKKKDNKCRVNIDGKEYIRIDNYLMENKWNFSKDKFMSIDSERGGTIIDKIFENFFEDKYKK